jgi:hypothetical protein
MAIPPNEVLSKGFSAGLQIWLGFLLGFFLLGYPAYVSIALGALAGIAGGFVIGWWEIREEPPAPEAPPADESLGDIAQDRRRHSRHYARRRRAKQEPVDWAKFRNLDNWKIWKGF